MQPAAAHHDAPALAGRAAVTLRRRELARRRRQQILAILAGASRPMSTAELTERLDAAGGGDVVLEAVYRWLLILLREGKVGRVPAKGKAVHWTLRADPWPGVPVMPAAAAAGSPEGHAVTAGKSPSLTETGTTDGYLQDIADMRPAGRTVEAQEVISE